MILILVVTGLFTYLTTQDRMLDPHETTTFLMVIVTSIISFFLSVSISLLAESEKIKSIRALLIQIGVILFGVFFYYTLDGYVFESLESVVLIFLTLAGFLSLLFVAPFMRRIITRKYDQDAYYSYFYRTSLVFLISSIVGATMMLL